MTTLQQDLHRVLCSFASSYQLLHISINILVVVHSYPFGGGFWWGVFTIQSPINDYLGSRSLPADYHLSPRILPYIALQYCKVAAVLVIAITAVVLVKCVHCPCASWRRPWAKLHRSVRHFRERRAFKGTVLHQSWYSRVIQQKKRKGKRQQQHEDCHSEVWTIAGHY